MCRSYTGKSITRTFYNKSNYKERDRGCKTEHNAHRITDLNKTGGNTHWNSIKICELVTGTEGKQTWDTHWGDKIKIIQTTGDAEDRTQTGTDMKTAKTRN